MGNDDKKNPWGNRPGNDDNSPWGAGKRKSSGGSNGRGPEGPDLDEVLSNFKTMIPSGFEGAPTIILAILVVLGLWLASGFYIVNPGENAVVQRFGAWERTQAESGLGYHFPSPIETSTIINVQEIKKMNIGFIEGFSRSGQAATRDIPVESLMLTSDRNIVDLDLVIQWNIKSAENFVFEILDQENTIKKVAESAIREVVGQTNMFPIITNQRQQVADRTKAIIQANLDEYKSGVNITDILIEKAEVHPDVQAAFQDVQSAKQDAEDVQNRADAYREDILPKARGRAIQMLQQAQAYEQSTIAKANGDADRFNSIYKAYQTGKDVTKERIYIETMENVLKNASKIILDSDAGQGAVPYLPLDQLGKKK